ncbi:MAG: hypothetical protein II961_00425 [Candidatus Riflebacteria bacterium]|nr:hypothetical protein [Candidatus Riflebacteria bacterium]
MYVDNKTESSAALRWILNDCSIAATERIEVITESTAKVESLGDGSGVTIKHMPK